MSDDKPLESAENIEVMSRTERAAKRAELPPPLDVSELSTKKRGKIDADEKKRRIKIIKRSIAGAVVLIAIFIWYGLQPLKGTIHHGICRTYAELTLDYPQTLELVDAYWFRDALRIHYSFKNPFGVTQSRIIECAFQYNSLALREVKIDRKKRPDKEVQSFNESLPGVIEGRPDIKLPSPYTGKLMDLWRG